MYTKYAYLKQNKNEKANEILSMKKNMVKFT